MKYTLLICIILLTCVQANVSGQTGFPYQAVMRNSEGVLVANKSISVRYAIHQKTADGTVVYQEQHAVQTDADGLFSLEIGKGAVEAGNFSTIDWQAGPYFVRTDVDHGSGYTLSGVQQLASMPYSEHAETAGGVQTLAADDSKWQLTVDDAGVMQVVSIPKGYGRLVFQEEFNYEGIPDPKKWGYEVGFERGSEMQYYANARLENTFVKDGHLTIRCINKDTLRKDDGAILNKKLLDGKEFYITSGSVITLNKGDWKYCRVEVRAKLPPGSGTWPAIWMLPTDKVYGDWPYSGEIDIMEYVGNLPEQFNCAAHFHDGEKKTAVGSKLIDPTATSDWHVFGFEWHDGRLEWYVDGVMYFQSKRPSSATPSSWPFNQRFYLILNFAFGGVWGGQGGYNVDLLPLDFLIDWVRVYQ
ncbi:MAG: glycoside hydrolase family 16 protein [Bacteroidales bacterium]|jgi:beta-glucanase (GH16 family)|nr:glycoside hydrolase family 16 protein [Bacteroidales bacterium]